MKYRYKKEFLAQFMKEHSLTRRDILTLIGTKDYKTFNKWMAGFTPVPIEYMIVICNHYGIDILDFFEVDGQPTQKDESTDELQVLVDKIEVLGWEVSLKRKKI